jgi:hypothetical protein
MRKKDVVFHELFKGNTQESAVLLIFPELDSN